MKKKKTTLKHYGKHHTMLVCFANGERHHRFSAELIGDHSLPSTISYLQKRYGLLFKRKWHQVPSPFIGTTKIKLYWLTGPDLKRANKIMRMAA